jgi:hypothetical protein
MSFPIAATAMVAHLTIVPIIKNIYPILTTIKDSLQVEEVVDIINKKDIEATLQVIEGLVNEISELKKKPKSMIKALENLNTTLKRVHELLEIIHNKTLEHSNKYFSSWRSLDIKNETKQLEIEFNLLEKRFNLLHKILMIYNDEFR